MTGVNDREFDIFVGWHQPVFELENGISLKRAFFMWQEYCRNVGLEITMPMHKFREELKKHFEKFEERATVNGVEVRNYFSKLKER